MEKPLVSIVTPTFNQAQYLEETIKSVLTQDYPCIEYIIIDGGSTDNTLDILGKYEDRIQWISEPDNGQADAINKGFRMSKGEILAWLNSDDTYCPGAIKTAVDYLLQNPDVFMIYGDGYEIDEWSRIIKKFPATQKFDLWKLIYVWDYILQPTVFMRKKSLWGLDLLDTSLNWCMDWDLWIRFGKRYKVAYVPRFFANSRVYSTTKTLSGGLRRLKEISYVMRKYGKKRYPPGLFIYGHDTFGTLIRTKLPLLYNIGLQYPLYVWRYLCSKLIHRGQGVYIDNWVTNYARFKVPLLGGNTLVIEGTIPRTDTILPLKIELELNKKEKYCKLIKKRGTFFIKHKITSSVKDVIDVIIRSNKTFKPGKVGYSNGRRNLSFYLNDIYVIKL